MPLTLALLFIAALILHGWGYGSGPAVSVLGATVGYLAWGVVRWLKFRKRRPL